MKEAILQPVFCRLKYGLTDWLFILDGGISRQVRIHDSGQWNQTAGLGDLNFKIPQKEKTWKALQLWTVFLIFWRQIRRLKAKDLIAPPPLRVHFWVLSDELTNEFLTLITSNAVIGKSTS